MLAGSTTWLEIELIYDEMRFLCGGYDVVFAAVRPRDLAARWRGSLRRRPGTVPLAASRLRQCDRDRISAMIVAASTVAVVAIAAAVIIVALAAWYILPRGGRRRRPPRT